jgi:SAM-dependent methyltransferase
MFVPSTPGEWVGWGDLESELTHFYRLDEDIEIYRDLVSAARGVSVELGIGAGRVAAVARPAIGVDFSTGALRAARDRLDYPVTLLHADFRDYRLDAPAALTYAPMNAVNLFDRDGLRDVLRNVRRNTLPGGAFVFDTCHPDPAWSATLRRAGGPLELRVSRADRVIREVVEVIDPAVPAVRVTTTIEHLDPETRTVRSRRTYPAYPFCWHSPQTMSRTIEQAGWAVTSRPSARQPETAHGSALQVWHLVKPGRGHRAGCEHHETRMKDPEWQTSSGVRHRAGRPRFYGTRVAP